MKEKLGTSPENVSSEEIEKELREQEGGIADVLASKIEALEKEGAGKEQLDSLVSVTNHFLEVAGGEKIGMSFGEMEEMKRGITYAIDQGMSLAEVTENLQQATDFLQDETKLQAAREALQAGGRPGLMTYLGRIGVGGALLAGLLFAGASCAHRDVVIVTETEDVPAEWVRGADGKMYQVGPGGKREKKTVYEGQSQTGFGAPFLGDIRD